MKLATWHWHIEISSKCTLKCSRCAREEVPDTLVNTELRLDFFEKNFTPDFIRDNVEKITFCGDDVTFLAVLHHCSECPDPTMNYWLVINDGTTVGMT